MSCADSNVRSPWRNRQTEVNASPPTDLATSVMRRFLVAVACVALLAPAVGARSRRKRAGAPAPATSDAGPAPGIVPLYGYLFAERCVLRRRGARDGLLRSPQRPLHRFHSCHSATRHIEFFTARYSGPFREADTLGSELVEADPADGCGALANAAALVNRTVLVQRGAPPAGARMPPTPRDCSSPQARARSPTRRTTWLLRAPPRWCWSTPTTACSRCRGVPRSAARSRWRRACPAS